MVNQKNLQLALERNPILVTALNATIGYEVAAAIAAARSAGSAPAQ